MRARLLAMAARAPLSVVAPVALVDYANPHNRLLASLDIPTRRDENGIAVRHPRWLYPPRGGWMNAFFLFARLLGPFARQRDRFDVIDAHYAHPEGIAAALLGRTLGKPFIVTIRGSELRYKQRGRRYWMGWALRRADRVIAVSNGLRDLAVELGVDPANTRVIPNGINSDVFFPRDRQACRRAHGIADDARLILCAGDLAELKGHHRVIKALRTLRGAGTIAQLVIAGGVGRSGRYADALRQQVKDHDLQDAVVFAGEKKQEALAELMNAADVFCLASSSEGWPNVVNEALACGTPVVVTDVGAVRQMIPSGDYGSIVPVDGERELAEALAHALSHPWNRARIADWGRSRSWSQVADEVIAELRTIVAARARAS